MADDFQTLLGRVRALSRVELLTLDAAVRGLLSMPAPRSPAEPPSDMPGSGPTPSTEVPPEGIAAIESAFAIAPECPHCQSKNIGKWGSANRLRRYRCRDCNISFNCLTGTPLAQLHKRELWAGHAQVIVDGISLRKGAERLDVHASTTFRWRHRFLAAPKALKALKIQGTVEADATFFRRSFKGCRKLFRKPHKRGGHDAKPGLYSLTLDTPQELPKRSIILQEARVAVTPMGRALRVAGTMEMAGYDLGINPPRIRGMTRSLSRYLPAFRPETFRACVPWCGLRPCTPDGLPYVGRTRTLRNVIVASGHAMMGVSMGPITGKLVSQIVSEEATSIDVAALRVERFG